MSSFDSDVSIDSDSAEEQQTILQKPESRNIETTSPGRVFETTNASSTDRHILASSSSMIGQANRLLNIIKKNRSDDSIVEKKKVYVYDIDESKYPPKGGPIKQQKMSESQNNQRSLRHNSKQRTDFSINLKEETFQNGCKPESRRGKPFKIGYKVLVEWATLPDVSSVLVDMAMNVEQIKSLLSYDTLNVEWGVHLITILDRVIDLTTHKGSLTKVFDVVCQSNFFSTILNDLMDNFVKRKYPMINVVFMKLMNIFNYIIKKHPSYKPKCSLALELIKNYANKLNLLHLGNELTDKLDQLLKNSTFSNLNPDADEFKILKSKSVIEYDFEEPLDNFKDLSTFPNIEELDSTIDVFLRKNKTRGAYRSLHHYLDIHFRLMREDYIEPLRLGLKHFMKMLDSEEHKVDSTDLRFYYDVSFIKMRYKSYQGISLLVKFDVTDHENTDWELSRRLRFGSLLCITKEEDLFENPIFGTVGYRKIESLNEGLVEVIFHTNLEQVFSSSNNQRFIMAETTAYFESYRHVLEGMKEIDVLPMEKYILSIDCSVNMPKYTEKSGFRFNLSPIMPTAPKQIDPTDENDWPLSEITNLNILQFEAVKLALTHELALIQGPPGTGKTYVGLLILRIILNSEIVRNKEEVNSPILVVCYTNHALDQFLSGLLPYCKSGIVRVGSQSQDEDLLKYNLIERRKNFKIKGKVLRHLRLCEHQQRTVSSLIERSWQEILRIESTILDVNSLKEEIDENLLTSLQNPRHVGRNSGILMKKWLRAASASVENDLRRVAERELEKLIAGYFETDPDETILVRHNKARLDYLTRIKIYCGWSNKYQIELQNQLRMHHNNPKSELEKAINEIKLCIPSDSCLSNYISQPAIFEEIKDCVRKECRSSKSVLGEDEEFFIKRWLLKGFHRTDQVLDCIEKLANTSSMGKGPISIKNSEDYSEMLNKPKRLVVADSDDEDCMRYETGTISDHDEDLSDDDQMSEANPARSKLFNEIDENYREHEIKEVHLLQRAKLLGLKLQDVTEENEDEDKMSYVKIMKLLKDSEALSEEETLQLPDLWDLPLKKRYSLYKFWIEKKREKQIENITNLTREYNLILREREEARSQRDIAILKQASVIGMTTTGAAKYRAVLQAVGCKIIVVEEAAEILESHTMTTLNKQCEHLILIGDHQQLKPNPTVYRLAKDYHLDMSMFERLVRNGLPRITLSEQHRMRPEISNYVRFIYPNLTNAVSVECYPDIEGVVSNVYFVQHSFEESEREDTMSKSNEHEAKFITALCRYFIQQGYEKSQITVLAAYGAQVKNIKEKMMLSEVMKPEEIESEEFEGIRVKSIDAYQGEENDIIILSLVRSNKEGKVGFLSTDNRVCVAISRAKQGFYVIGNMDLLAKKSELWCNIWKTAKQQNKSSTYLPLRCVNHPDHISYVSKSEDFTNMVPEGGCNRPCEKELICGHFCNKMCHAADREHIELECKQPCFRVCDYGHQCQKLCYEDCGECQYLVLKKIPYCEHEINLPCSLDESLAVCTENCEVIMACGHTCRGSCGKCWWNQEHQPCLEKVEKTWKACGHTSKVECCVDPNTSPCPFRCETKLQCNHTCSGNCGSCLQGKVHVVCEKSCGKALPCGHACAGKCSTACLPCQKLCPTKCRHSLCSKKTCGEICEECMENCDMTCKHKRCSCRCSDPCDSKPCLEKCGLIVKKCKHKCQSMCGEKCICYKCEKKNFFLIDFSTSKPKVIQKGDRFDKFIVEENDILMKLPRCKHIFTMKQLDDFMTKYPKGTSYYRCPNCSAPIQTIRRYENLIKTRMESREIKKNELIIASQVSIEKFEKLQRSKDLLDNKNRVDDGRFLEKSQNDIDAVHAQALTLQIRFAFCLEQIMNIQATFLLEENLNPKWENTVSRIRFHISKQMSEELSLELHRLLLMQQIYVIKRFTTEVENIQIPNEIKATLKKTLRTEIQDKLTRENMKRFYNFVNELYKLFDEQEAGTDVRDDVDSLKERADVIRTILEEPHDKDLCDIIDKED